MYKILLVEDDSALCENLAKNLAHWNFETDRIINFQNISDEFLKSRPDLILMDVNLPWFDGFYWCRRIREISKTPILFLSSRDSDMDIIMAVHQGADDYIVKPFRFDLLVAKIQALLRRTYDYRNDETDKLECRGIILDVSGGLISYLDRKTELTKNELKILSLLIKNKGKTVSRERLMRALWDDDCFVNENTLTVNINRLRSTLEGMGLKDFITTRKGEGYIIL